MKNATKKQKIKAALKTALVCLLTAAMLSACELPDFESWFGNKTNDSGKLVAHFLDVGQGDSIFIELPNDETMLIDAGENYRGEGIIKYIQSTGHDKIDYLIGTHPHSDHIGSMAYIVRNFDIGEIYMPKVSANTKQFESLLAAVKKKGMNVKNGKSGVRVVKDGKLSADIIAPIVIDESNLNNCSIVLRLTYGDNTFLFTGDAKTGEMDTVKEDISADVLKVGHHGGKNASTQKLIESISPEIAVISCGKNNEYGHPHKEVLSYLKKVKSSVYRTDRQKTVKVTSNGKDLKVETGAGSIARAK